MQRESDVEHGVRIPRVLHFIWLGNEGPRPDALIAEWARFHPDWTVCIWTDDDLRAISGTCRLKLDALAGRAATQAAVLRWWILLEQGGVVVAADSLCLRALPDSLLDTGMFASWEHEQVASGRLCANYIGAVPDHPLVRRVVASIASTADIAALPPDEAAGGALLTRAWHESGFADLTVLPDHSFVPFHPDAEPYRGPGAVYACELWASRLGLVPTLASLGVEAVRQALLRDAPRRAPWFSIVVITHNRAHDLPAAIASARAQTFSDHEIVVVDDGSTDDTQQVLARLAGDDLVCVRTEHGGCGHARNRALEAASGEYLVCLDSDDMLMPDCLERYARVLSADPAPDVLYGNLVVVDRDWNFLETWDYARRAARPRFPDLFLGNVVPNPGTAVRRRFASSIGGYDEHLPGSVCEDYDFWVRAAAAGARFEAVDAAVCAYRVHGSNITVTNQRVREAECAVARKAIDRLGLRVLLPQLPWAESPKAAEDEARAIAARLFIERRDWETAAQLCRSACVADLGRTESRTAPLEEVA